MQAKISYSDDYAVAESGRYLFYYGYEKTKDDQWCFVVEEMGKEVFRLTTKEIEQKIDHKSHIDMIQDYLLAGIMLWKL